jgi:hypothetical protein
VETMSAGLCRVEPEPELAAGLSWGCNMFRLLARALKGRAVEGGDCTRAALLLGTSGVLALLPSAMTGLLKEAFKLFDLAFKSVWDRVPTLTSGCVGPTGKVELRSLLLLAPRRRLLGS